MGHGMNSVLRRCLRHRLPPRKRPRDSSTTSTRSPRPTPNRNWPSPSTLCQTAKGKEYRREAIEHRAGSAKGGRAAATDPSGGGDLTKGSGKRAGKPAPGPLVLHRGEGLDPRNPLFGKGRGRGTPAIARQDMASSPADGEQEAKLGDAWWDLAQSRAGQDRLLCLSRAGFWSGQEAARKGCPRPAADANGKTACGPPFRAFAA